MARVQPPLVVDRAAHIAYRYDPCAPFMHHTRGPASNIAKPLNCHRCILQMKTQTAAQHRPGYIRDAQTGGVLPTGRASHSQRFAGRHSRHRIASMHRIGVHDPGHHPCIRAHVRRGNVHFRPNEKTDFRRVAPGHRLQFSFRERLRIHDDTPFGPAIGKVHQRAFPRHPHRQRPRLVQAHFRMVADASFRRP